MLKNNRADDLLFKIFLCSHFNTSNINKLFSLILETVEEIYQLPEFAGNDPKKFIYELSINNLGYDPHVFRRVQTAEELALLAFKKYVDPVTRKFKLHYTTKFREDSIYKIYVDMMRFSHIGDFDVLKVEMVHAVSNILNKLKANSLTGVQRAPVKMFSSVKDKKPRK